MGVRLEDRISERCSIKVHSRVSWLYETEFVIQMIGCSERYIRRMSIIWLSRPTMKVNGISRFLPDTTGHIK